MQRPGGMRALLISLAALLVLAAPAAASGPVRLWSVSRVDSGSGAVPVQSGSQVGGELYKQVGPLGIVAFNLPLPSPYWENLPRDDAYGALFSNATGAQYSVLTQAPSFNPRRAHSPKGSITHLDEYQAYVKQASDASLKITISGLLLQNVDDNGSRFGSWECPSQGNCEPVRSVVRVRARAYAASAGGDFFDAGGAAYLVGHQHSWRPGAATVADAPGPLWGEEQFSVDGDRDDSNTGASAAMSLKKPRTLKVPLGSIRTGELFAVHVSLEAESVDDRGAESAAQAAIQDPQQREPGLLTARGLRAVGKPRFKEPPIRPLAPARCTTRRPGAGLLSLSDAGYATNESSRSAMILVDRTGGSRGPASVTLTARGGTARAGSDFTATTTTVRFGNGDHSPRLVEIPLREDGAEEPGETFTVELSHARCGALGAQHSAPVTIADDDQPPLPEPPPAPAPSPSPAPVPTVTPPPPSGLDRTFGPDGRVSTPVGAAFGAGQAVVIQPDGDIVTVGSRGATESDPDDFELTQHDASGKLLQKVTTDLGGTDDQATDAALLSDGGVVAVGSTNPAGIGKPNIAVVRYRPDLTPDPGFGTQGIVRTDLPGAGEQANAVAVQPDGKIVVAGYAINGINRDFALVRYDAHGNPDPDFGTQGVVTTDLGTNADEARAIAIQPDGRIVVAGVADEDVALARYTTKGELDPTFDHDGKTVTSFSVAPDVANGVALMPDGRIEVAGYTLGAHINRDFLLARYSAQGALDQTVVSDLGTGDDFAENLVVDGQGRTILVGRTLNSGSTFSDLALVRYDAAGNLDRSFDGDGIVTADFHGRGDFGQDVALDAQGRIVAGGYAADGPDEDFALLRANP